MPTLPRPKSLGTAVFGEPSVLKSEIPGLRAILDIIGPNDDLGTPLGVSVFAKPGLAKYSDGLGLAMRKEATNAMRAKLAQMLENVDPIQQKKIFTFLDKYPRVAAHVADVDNLPPGSSHAGAMIRQQDEGIAKILLNTHQPQTGNALAHEMTHVAQNIGEKKNAGENYARAGRAFGYYDNPYEVSARAVAEKHFPTEYSPMDRFINTIGTPAGVAGAVGLTAGAGVGAGMGVKRLIDSLIQPPKADTPPPKKLSDLARSLEGMR